MKLVDSKWYHSNTAILQFKFETDSSVFQECLARVMNSSKADQQHVHTVRSELTEFPTNSSWQSGRALTYSSVCYLTQILNIYLTIRTTQIKQVFHNNIHCISTPCLLCNNFLSSPTPLVRCYLKRETSIQVVIQMMPFMPK